MQSSSSATHQVDYTSQLIDVLNQPDIDNAEILRIFAQARIDHETVGTEAQEPSNQLTRSTTQISVPEDSLQEIYLGEEYEGCLEQFEQEQEVRRSLEQQKQLADLAASQLQLEVSFNQEQSVLQKIFELEKPEIINAALEHIRFAYGNKPYGNLPKEITEALEQRQQAYFEYQELAGYFSKAIDYLVRNIDKKPEYCRLFIRKLLNEKVSDGEAVVERPEMNRDQSGLSVMSVESLITTLSGEDYYENGDVVGKEGVFEQAPHSPPLRVSVSNRSSIFSSAGAGGDSHAGVRQLFADSVDTPSYCSSWDDSVLSRAQQRAQGVIKEMLTDAGLAGFRQPTCFSRNGSFVDRLNKIKSKIEAQNIKAQEVGSVQRNNNLEAKSLDAVLNNAQKAGEQKQVVFLAEKALVKLLKHLNGRWLGLWDKGGKKAAVEGLLEQLKVGAIDQKEFVRQLSESSSPLSSDSPASESGEFGEQSTVYDKLKSPTGWFQWNGYKAQSALEAEEAVKIFNQLAVKAG